MKSCTACKELKPFSEYHNLKRAKDGLAYYCKSCVKAQFKKYHDAIKIAEPAFIPTAKTCLDCKLEKPISQFGKKSSALDKHQKYCKPCWRVRTYKAIRKMNGR
jgi:hypothetical protein